MDFLWRNITAESRPDRVQKVDLLWREVRSACFDCGWPQMIFDKHVGDTRLFAIECGIGKKISGHVVLSVLACGQVKSRGYSDHLIT